MKSVGDGQKFAKTLARLKGEFKMCHFSKQALSPMALVLLALALFACTVTIPPPQVVTATPFLQPTPTSVVLEKSFDVSALGWNDTGMVISVGDTVQISVIGGRWTTY